MTIAIAIIINGFARKDNPFFPILDSLNKELNGENIASIIISNIFIMVSYLPKNKLIYSNNADLLSIATIQPAVAT